MKVKVSTKMILVKSTLGINEVDKFAIDVKAKALMKWKWQLRLCSLGVIDIMASGLKIHYNYTLTKIGQDQ